jgi:hypothetical protein
MEKGKDCFHYSHHMFFRCPKYQYDKHLHCISCGEILPDDEDLRDMVKAGKVYHYRFSCEKLCGYDDVKSSP